MCKNLMLAGIAPALSSDKLLWKFLIEAGEAMSTNDKDGLGYAALSTKNGLYGERWVNPKDAFSYRKELDKSALAFNDRLGGSLEMSPKYNFFGKLDSSDTVAVVLHARMSTNKVNIENTHPFVDNDENIALIHNGVVTSFSIKNETSTCDSELILNSYVNHDVTNIPSNIAKVAEDLRGSYACGVLGIAENGVEFLDIFRNDTNPLYAIQVRELGAVAFTTDPSHVERTCTKLGWKYGGAYKLKPEMLIRLNASTGELLSKHDFKSSQLYNSAHYPSTHGWQGREGY